MSLVSLCRWQVQVSYIVLGGYLRILDAHNVESCCTLSISASYRVLFVFDIANPHLFVADIANPDLFAVDLDLSPYI